MKTICWYYNNAVCVYGDNCIYEHIEVMDLKKNVDYRYPIKDKWICKYDKTGICKNTANCNYIHKKDIMRPISPPNNRINKSSWDPFNSKNFLKFFN
jgi:hypothetical protein